MENNGKISTQIVAHISSSTCSVCGSPAPDWKCPGCGMSSKVYDPMHWRTCSSGRKMQAQCQKCSQAEEKCSCVV